ncbi:MAG: pro-sigmaK processing inhibitor BofA family protein [Bacillota bacterium]
MDLNTAFFYAMGVILVLMLLHVLAKPLEVALRVLGSSLVGGLVLWVVNLAGGLVGFHIGLNPVSAMIVGVLGVPGLLGLGLLRAIVG